MELDEVGEELKSIFSKTVNNLRLKTVCMCCTGVYVLYIHIHERIIY